MKIKTVGSEYLLVFLSSEESAFLRIDPRKRTEDFRKNYILSGIYAVAAKSAGFSLESEKVKLWVLADKEDNAVLVFHGEQKKKYRVKETNAPFLCIFNSSDDFLQFFLRRKSQSSERKTKLYALGEKYILIVFAENGQLSADKSLFREYGRVCRITALITQKLKTKGSLIGENLL